MLIERFQIDPGQLPIVLCPGGQLLRNPGEIELARCLGLLRPIDSDRVYDVVVVGAGPAGLATAVYAAPRASQSLFSIADRFRRSSRRIGQDRKLSRLSDGNQRHGADGACLPSGAEIRSRDGDPR